MKVLSFLSLLLFLVIPLSGAGMALGFAIFGRSPYRRAWVVRLIYCAIALVPLLVANSMFASVILPIVTGGEANNPAAGLAADGEYYIAQLDGTRTRVTEGVYHFLLWYEFLSSFAASLSVVPIAAALLLFPVIVPRIQEFIRRGGEIGLPKEKSDRSR